MREDTQQHDTRRLPGPGGVNLPETGGNILGRLLGSLMTKVIVLVVIVLVGAYALVAKLEDLNPFSSHTTITTTLVLGKLTKIEQVHVATRSYPVDVKTVSYTHLRAHET